MPLKTHVDEEPALNLTSMIDVLFLLIIFFMAGAKFDEMDRKIAIQVPQVTDGKQLPAAPQRITVNVYPDGSLTLDHQRVSLEELFHRLKELRQRNPSLSVMVRGDGQGPLQNVTNVLNACSRAGIAEMGIAVRLASQANTERR